jgi:hypothetical protein
VRLMMRSATASSSWCVTRQRCLLVMIRPSGKQSMIKATDSGVLATGLPVRGSRANSTISCNSDVSCNSESRLLLMRTS